MALRLLSRAVAGEDRVFLYVDNHLRPYMGEHVIPKGWHMQGDLSAFSASRRVGQAPAAGDIAGTWGERLALTAPAVAAAACPRPAFSPVRRPGRKGTSPRSGWPIMPGISRPGSEPPYATVRHQRVR